MQKIKRMWLGLAVLMGVALPGYGQGSTELFPSSNSLAGAIVALALSERERPSPNEAFFNKAHIKVYQVMPEGLLVCPTSGYGTPGETTVIFVSAKERATYVDGDLLASGWYVYTGPFSYNAIDGSSRSVRSFRRLDEKAAHQIERKRDELEKRRTDELHRQIQAALEKQNQAEIDKKNEEIGKKREEVEQQQRELEQFKRAAPERQRQAEAEAELERQRLAIEQERLALEKAEREQRERERLEREREQQKQAEIDRKKRAEAEAEREKQRIALEKKMAEEAQPGRQALAEKLFTEVGLLPGQILGEKGKAAGWSLEPVGKGWLEITKLYNAKDWVGLMQFLGEDTPYGLLPDEKSITNAADTFTRRERDVLIRGDPATIMKNMEYIIRFEHFSSEPKGWEPYEPRTVSYPRHTHPDGIGIILALEKLPWLSGWENHTKSDALHLFTVCKGVHPTSIRNEPGLNKPIQQYNATIGELNGRLKLGEIDDPQYRERLKEAGIKCCAQQREAIRKNF